MFKILSTYICGKKKYIKCNIWRAAVRPSYIEDARFLKVNYPLSEKVCMLCVANTSSKFTIGNTMQIISLGDEVPPRPLNLLAPEFHI